MLTTLSLLNWLSFSAALVLFIGPGYAIFAFLPDRSRFDRTQSIALAIGLSMAAWSILLAWLHLIRLPLSPISAPLIFGLSWTIGLWRVRPRVRSIRVDGSRVMLWLALIVTAIASVSVLRNLPLAPGSDIYHHTAITKLIADRGLLPDNYLPYADLVTFTYHYGFHALAAAVVWISGLDPVVATPLVAQMLPAASALTIALLTEVATRNRTASLISAIFAGLVIVFPAYYINWGRDTQLSGLVILPVVLAVTWHWLESGVKWRAVPFIGGLAGGLALAHYRVTLMAASGFIVLFGVSGVLQRWEWPMWRRVATRLMLAALFAGVLVGPWVWHLINASHQGYAIRIGQITPAFFAFERLGPGVQNYATNIIVISLTALAIVSGWWRRDRVVIGLSLWSIGMVVFSTPRFAGVFMDTTSVVISLYVPTAITIGWLLAKLVERWPRTQWAMYMALMLLAVWGANQIGNIVDPTGVYTTQEDLQAMAWIKANTPPTAQFMANAFHVYDVEKYITGEDAGYWLPLLAERAVFVPPLVFPNERAATPDFADRLEALSRTQANMATPETLALFQRAGITHVYLGAKGTVISAAALLQSPDYRLIYQNPSVYVFEIVVPQ